MKFPRTLNLALACMITACGTVNSSELRSDKASDLTLEAHFYASNASDLVTVDGQMETSQSHTKVEFDQGQELYVAVGTTEEDLAWDDFSDSFAGALFEGLDSEYIDKASDNEKYHIKYIDNEGNETIISIEPNFVAELTSPEADTNVGETVELTWDPEEEMNGRLYAIAEYRSDSKSGTIIQLIEENNGSFIFDISEAEGTGTIKLTHVTSYDDLEGFEQTDVDISTSSQEVSVTFNAP